MKARSASVQCTSRPEMVNARSPATLDLPARMLQLDCPVRGIVLARQTCGTRARFAEKRKDNFRRDGRSVAKINGAIGIFRFITWINDASAEGAEESLELEF